MRNTLDKFLSKFRKQPPVVETPVKRPIKTCSDVLRTYSKRLLSPYVGVVQVAEVGYARALSIDGNNWAIRYALVNHDNHDARFIDDPRQNYVLVATVEQGCLKIQGIHPILDPDEVMTAVNRLHETVAGATVPFAAADQYEYWLLDRHDNQPLALLHSTVDMEDMHQSPPQPTWIAMPHAQLEVMDPLPRTGDGYTPPINYRLQELIEERAGPKPRATWFKRTDPSNDDFPHCLIREDWDTEYHQQLCDLYIQRLAPRLLMIDGLPTSVRQRLEQAARDYVFEVERFYRLYPTVIDQTFLNTARVEARLRRAAKGQPGSRAEK